MSRSLLVFLALAGCAVEDATPRVADALVDAAAPPSGLHLVRTTPVSGGRMQAYVRGATPGATVYLAASDRLGAGPCPVALGGCLDLVRPQLVAEGVADGSGAAYLDVDVPAGTVGDRLFLQAGAVGDGVSHPARDWVSAPIALAGAWDDSFGGTRDITSRQWFDFGTFDLLQFDNGGQWALALNGPDTFFPGRFSRFDWTIDGSGRVFYCQSAFDAASLPAARAGVADATDPATAGCGAPYPGGFSWTELTPAAIAIGGTFLDGWGTNHVVSNDLWEQDFGTWHLTHFSNARSFAVGQNDHGNSFFPGLWSRFDWTVDGAGDTWYCQTAYAAATEADALETPPADAGDLAAGCGGFGWTLLTP